MTSMTSMTSPATTRAANMRAKLAQPAPRQQCQRRRPPQRTRRPAARPARHAHAGGAADGVGAVATAGRAAARRSQPRAPARLGTSPLVAERRPSRWFQSRCKRRRPTLRRAQPRNLPSNALRLQQPPTVARRPNPAAVEAPRQSRACANRAKRQSRAKPKRKRRSLQKRPRPPCDGRPPRVARRRQAPPNRPVKNQSPSAARHRARRPRNDVGLGELPNSHLLGIALWPRGGLSARQPIADDSVPFTSARTVGLGG